MTFDDTIRRTVHIESEEDLGDTPFTYYLDGDIGDTVSICEDADVYMREDKNGWAIYWHNNLMEKIDASDEDDKETYIKKYRKAQQEYKKVCNASLDGTLERECLSGDENGQPSFDYSNAVEVFKQFGESSKIENVFASILRESYNHDSSKEKVMKLIQGPITKWFNEYGYKVVGPDEELPSIPSDESHPENCAVKYTIKNDEKTSGKYEVNFRWARIFHNYAHTSSCNELLAEKVMGFKPNKDDNRDWLKQRKAELQAVGQFFYKIEAEAKSFGLDIKFKYKDADYTSSQEFDFTVTDIEGTAAHEKHLGVLTSEDWNKETEEALIKKYNLIPLPELTFSKTYGRDTVESRFYIFGKGTNNTTLVRVFCEDYHGKGCIKVIAGCTNEYSEDAQAFYLTQEDYKDPEIGADAIKEILH